LILIPQSRISLTWLTLSWYKIYTHLQFYIYIYIIHLYTYRSCWQSWQCPPCPCLWPILLSIPLWKWTIQPSVFWTLFTSWKWLLIKILWCTVELNLHILSCWSDPTTNSETTNPICHKFVWQVFVWQVLQVVFVYWYCFSS